MSIEVLSARPGVTVQDLGRVGYGDLGVGRSGAADRGSLRLANRLVGNAPDSAALEVTMGDFAFRAGKTLTIALAGAHCPFWIDDRPQWTGDVVTVRQGQVVRIGQAVSGLRVYVAIRGGVCVAPVLGSRSTDTLGGLGPEPIAEGMELPIGAASAFFPTMSGFPLSAMTDQLTVRVTAGPRADWFEAGLAALTDGSFSVSSDLDRVGVRLVGDALRRARAGELPPEAAVPGAVQVPPDGQPIVFLADHPVTGGYPVVAVVDEGDLDRVAQARPGAVIRFVR